jgi:beta-lactamase regulating signal transducer with metallopeptidase domain
MTDALLTWLGSYLLHSSLLIAGLWALERAGALRRLGVATQEALWRLALLGGLLSASLPLLPTLPPLPSAPQPAPVVAAAPEPTPASDFKPLPVVVDATALAMESRPSAQLGELALPKLLPQTHDLAVGFLLLWLAGALLMGAGLALQWAWLRRQVARLSELNDRRWQNLVAEMSTTAGVAAPRLRHARTGWASPLLAPGRVLCLPAWCLDLPDDEARAVLGHELAHLRRRDPAWRLLAAVVKALLWPQALNRVALQRLDLLAELACDAAAAQPSGQRLALAQSLLRCAEALRSEPAGPALACGAAGQGSPLLARVRSLLKPETETPRERRVLRWGLLAGMLGLLIALPAVVVSHTSAGALLDRFDLGEWADAGFMRHFTSDGSATRMVSRYPGGSFTAELDGKVAFNDAEDDVQTLTGRLIVREREGGLVREMTLTSMGEGLIQRDYRVGRQSAPLDDAGRQWWAKAAKRAAEAMTDPNVRARRLFERGGIDAVLADLDRADEDFARRQRIEALMKLGQPLAAPVQDRLIAVADKIGGGFERRETLRAIAGLGLAEPQQLGWLKAAARVDGGFERREALAALVPHLAATPAVLQAWQEALAGIDGDFELRTAIENQVGATPQAAVLGAALQASRRLQGDFEKRETLAAVARRMNGDEAELVADYTSIAAGIQGGFERREALNQLLDRPKLSTPGLERVLDAAEGMDTGFERLQVLLRVADKLAGEKPISADLVQRLRRAGRGLAEHERGQLENALDRLG